MEKTKTVEVPYTACDWCEKEITKEQQVHHFHGDFPTVSFHVNPCLRQSAVFGARNKKATGQ